MVEKNQIAQEAEELRKQIRHHNELYYNQDAPEIEDWEYDALMNRLKEIEKEFPQLVTKDSPTQIVGGKRVMGIAVEHRVPMLSLLDVFSEDEVISFVDGTHDGFPDAKFDVERKIDGLSLSLLYEDGKLVQASTRGDGHVGEDVTANIKALHSVPAIISTDIHHLELRGECYLSEADFERVNTEQEVMGKKLFANPRNCAAGTLRQSDPTVAGERNLQVFIFNVQDADEEFKKLGHYAQMQAVEKFGFKTASAYGLCKTADEVLAAIKYIGNGRDELPYPIDGAVVKIDQMEIRKAMGERTKNPKWAVAFKYPPEEKNTVLRDIVLQTGRTGRVTPVAVFDAVQLAGTSVTNATLHNQGRIDELHLHIGDTIVVRKAGDIIPEIVRVAKHIDNGSEVFQLKVCPVCGAELIRETEDGADLYCSNIACPAKTLQRIVFFGSKACMDINGLGPSIAEMLVENDFVRVPSDLYHLEDEEVELIEMLGEKTYRNLLASIEKSKSQSAVRVLKALGWRNVGAHAGETLLKVYGSITNLFSAYEDDTSKLYNYLVTLDGFGDTLAQAVIGLVSNDGMRKEVYLLNRYGVNMAYQSASGDVLAGLTFVITGTLPTMGRDEAKTLIEANGGKVSGSVSKKTSYLLCGSAAGSKLDKAKELGVKVITEDDLKNMLA